MKDKSKQSLFVPSVNDEPCAATFDARPFCVNPNGGILNDVKTLKRHRDVFAAISVRMSLHQLALECQWVNWR